MAFLYGIYKFLQPVLSIDSDIKCDLALESVQALLENLNLFVAETRSSSFTRVEVLKAQILFDEVRLSVKMVYICIYIYGIYYCIGSGFLRIRLRLLNVPRSWLVFACRDSEEIECNLKHSVTGMHAAAGRRRAG